jgi:hypothetical protein
LTESDIANPRPSDQDCASEGAVCFMKNVSAVVAIWVGLAAVPVIAADGIQPGLWKITTVAVNNGMKMPPQTNERCLTAEQANDLADTFSPRFGGMNTTCQRAQYAKTEQKLTWRLECRGQFNMDSAAEFTFFSPLRYTAVISTKGWIGDQQLSDTQVTLEGEYVGACQ